MVKQRRSLVVIVTLMLLGIPVILAGAFSANERIWSLTRNTLHLVTLTCAIALPLGTFLAIVVVRTNVCGRKTISLLLAVTLFVPLYLQNSGWNAGFGQLGWMRLSDGTPFLDGLAAAAWIHAMAAIAWVALIVGVALRFAPRELEEQELLDGSTRQVFFEVTLRGVMPAIVVAALWVAVTTAGDITVTNIYGVDTYAEELNTTAQLNLDQARSGAMTSVLIVGWLVFAALLLTSSVASRFRRISLQRPRVFELRGWRLPLTIVSWLIVGLVVGLPLANLAYQAGDQLVTVDGVKMHRWSLGAFCQIIAATPHRFAAEFGWTFAISATAATMTVAVALPLAWLARRGGWRSAPVLCLAAICLSLPGPLIGIELIQILNQRDSAWLVQIYDRSIFPPATAMLIRSLPLAILIGWFAFRSISGNELESASIDGAGGWTRFLRIAAAQRVAAIVAIWLISFSISMGDLAATNLVSPPGVHLLSVRIFGLLHAGVTSEVAGICLLNVLTFAVVAALTIGLLKLSALKR